MDNLPSWLGASNCYVKAQRILHAMAMRALYKYQSQNKRWRYHQKPDNWPTLEAVRLMDALNDGDEELIKGLLAYKHIYYE